MSLAWFRIRTGRIAWIMRSDERILVEEEGNAMSTNRPDTIVLIHGFWVTPRS